MIARRPFSRLIFNFSPNACVANPRCYSQGRFFDHNLRLVRKMGRGKDGSNSTNRDKKQKAISTMWRPVSTQSGSHEVHLVNELKTNLRDPHEAVDCSEKYDVRCHVHEAHPNMSSCIPDSNNLSQDQLVADKNVSLTSSTSTVIYDGPCESVGGEQSLSVSCNMEKLTENFGSRIDSESDKALHQEQVKEETLDGLGSKRDAELAYGDQNHSVPVEVDAPLLRFVKGKGGSTQRQIEEETGVKLIFPSSKEDNSIVIEGTSTESVTKASQRIASVLQEAVESPNFDYSHFISLPLAIHPELVEKLHDFQRSILGDATSSNDGNLESDSNEDASDDGDEDKQSESPNVAVKLEVQDEKELVTVKIDTPTSYITPKSYPVKVKTDTTAFNSGRTKTRGSIFPDTGIDKSIFIKPRTFHLTVLMLKLWNKDRIVQATEVLQRISSKVNDALDNRPVSVRLKGLECMRGSPAKAHVLYAPVQEIGGEGRLLRACQVIIEAYVEAGLVLEKDARHTLKLHATLMKARHGKRKTRTRRHDSFDARGIFRRYGSEEWGDYLVREAHLSQRFSFDENGYYRCCASIPFPESMQTE